MGEIPNISHFMALPTICTASTHSLVDTRLLSLSRARSQPANQAVDETNSCEENVFRIEHLTWGSQNMGPLDGADTERPQWRPVCSVLHQPRPRNTSDTEHPLAPQGCNSIDILGISPILSLIIKKRLADDRFA